MIKANELRIGNIILFDQKIDEVKSIGETMCFGHKHSHWYFDRLHCIPLTPQILQKVGFTATQQWYRVELVIERKASILNAIISTDLKTAFIEHYEHIKYLHQLQNLYFALTGEELPIALTSLQ